jgi:hypothetical protein
MRWPPAALLLLVLYIGAQAAAAEAINGHFTITNTTGTTGTTGTDAGLMDVLEKAYDRVDGRFGACPGHIEVIVVGDSAMDEEAGEQVDAFSAWNKAISAIILRQSAVDNRASLPLVAEHEMCHLAVNEILCKKDPAEFRWMEEGVCTLASGEPLNDADVAKYIVEHGFLGVGDIQGAVKCEHCTVSRNGYMQSYSLVKRMADKYGMKAVIGVLECPHARVDRAFLECTGEDFHAFYDAWRKDVMAAAS